MMELLLSLFALIIFIGIMALAISFGLALFGVVIICGLLLGAFVVLRAYYLRWKYGRAAQPQETVTIIETDYKDISDK